MKQPFVVQTVLVQTLIHVIVIAVITVKHASTITAPEFHLITRTCVRGTEHVRVLMNVLVTMVTTGPSVRTGVVAV